MLSNACGGVGAICNTGKCPDGDCNGAGSGGCLQVNLFLLGSRINRTKNSKSAYSFSLDYVRIFQKITLIDYVFKS